MNEFDSLGKDPTQLLEDIVPGWQPDGDTSQWHRSLRAILLNLSDSEPERD